MPKRNCSLGIIRSARPQLTNHLSDVLVTFGETDGTVEPFSITCTTCQAKLKVRSAEAIGQIFSCPKCESMVQVVAPADWTPDIPATAQSPSAPAETPAAANTPAPPPQSEPVPPADTSTSSAADQGASDWENTLADAASELDKLPKGTVPASASPAPPVELPPLNANWASPTEALGRKVMLYVVAGGAALLVVGGLIGYWLSGETPVAAEDANQAQEQPADADSSEPDAADNIDADNTTSADANDAPPAEEKSTEPQQPKFETALPAETPKAEETAEVETPPTDTATSVEEAPMSTGEKIAAETSTAAETAAPLEEKTAPASAPEKAESTDVVASADPPATTDLLADDSFDALLPTENDAPKIGDAPTGQVMTEEELAAAAEAAEDLPAETSDPSHSGTPGADNDINNPAQAVQRVPMDSRVSLLPVEQTLELRFPHIRFTATPLARLLGELSDLSALPIRLDLMAFQAASISPDVPVTVDLEDKTLSEILTEILASRGLTYSAEGRQLLITTAASAGDPRKVKFSVDDLAADEDKLRELAAMIVKGVAPQSWEFADGNGKISLDGDRLLLEHQVPIVYEAVIFCERLRKSRDLPVRSRLPASQLQLTTARNRAAKVLSAPVTCTFHEPTRLVDVLRYLEELSGAKIFVDWKSLSHADLSLMDQITCTLPQQPLSKALETLLTPLELDYRVLDENTIEIFALVDLPNKMTREFYPMQALLSAGVKMEVLLTGINQMTGEGAWNEDSGGLIWYDPVGQHLLIRNSHKVHGQIAHLLDELSRKLAAKK